MKNDSWKIRDVEIPNRVVVAPMAGISNAAFRVVCKEFGAGLVVCEMISDHGIIYRNKKTLNKILPEYDQYLDEYVQSKIWSELSELDKKIVTEMSLSRETQVKTLRERLDMKSELLNV